MSKGAATCIAFVSKTHLIAGSSDHTLFLFDLKSGEVERRFRGHHGVINAVDVQRGGMGKGLIASASDDGTVRVWSEDAKEEIEVVELGYPITAVSECLDVGNESCADLRYSSSHRSNGLKMVNPSTSEDSTTMSTSSLSPLTPSPTPSVPTQTPSLPSRSPPTPSNSSQ